MSTIVNPFIKRLTVIEDNLPEIAKKIIQDNAPEIVLLVKGQLSHGFNSSGGFLKWSGGDGFYAPNTQDFADRDNISTPKVAGQPYNFSWTGETLDNLAMGVIGKSTFDITTVASKKALLESIYGEIFDLTEEHNDYVNNEILLPQLYEYILNNMTLGLI